MGTRREGAGGVGVWVRDGALGVRGSHSFAFLALDDERSRRGSVGFSRGGGGFERRLGRRTFEALTWAFETLSGGDAAGV